MNNVTISGTITHFYDMTSAIVIASLHNEEGVMYLYWNKNKFKKEEIENSYVIVNGILGYLKVKMNKDSKPKKILAIEARSIEKYDF